MAKSVSFKNGGTTPTEEGYVAKVDNGKGYKDLFVFLNNNGKAVRIDKKDGSEGVFINRTHIPALIAALQHINAKNVRTSVNSISYAA